jgi:hypothetical protein
MKRGKENASKDVRKRQRKEGEEPNSTKPTIW